MVHVLAPVQILQLDKQSERHWAIVTIGTAMVSIGDGYLPGLHWVHVRKSWVPEATEYERSRH